MRRRAIERGLRLNEYGLEGADGLVPCKTEKDLFKALGLAYIPPELREDEGEFDSPRKAPFPGLSSEPT